MYSSKSQFFWLPRAALFGPLAVLITPLGCPLVWLCPHLGANDRGTGKQRKRETASSFPHHTGTAARLRREESSLLSELWLLWALFVIPVITALGLLVGWGQENWEKEKKGNVCTLSSLGVSFPTFWARMRGLLKLSLILLMTTSGFLAVCSSYRGGTQAGWYFKFWSFPTIYLLFTFRFISYLPKHCVQIL